MPIVVTIILALVFSIAAIIAAYLFIIPEKKVKSLPPICHKLHSIFTFKSLLIEKINRFLYVFLTIITVITGFFMLFTVVDGVSMFFPGLLTILIAPILLRILFESAMLKIIMTNNIIELNKKASPKPAARAQRPAPRPAPSYENDTSYNSYGE